MSLRVGICRRARVFLLLLPLLIMTAGLGTAAAQTAIVRSAPPGSTIELTMNGGAVTSATADNYGDATLTVPARTAEAAVEIHVDDCGNRVRVLIVERGLQPSTPEPGCSRIDIGSVFVMRPMTTFVVDIDSSATSVHLTQGPPPAIWVQRGAAAAGSSRSWGTPTNGLVGSAGLGYSMFR